MFKISEEIFSRLNDEEIDFLCQKFNLTRDELKDADADLVIAIAEKLNSLEARFPVDTEKFTDEDLLVARINSVISEVLEEIVRKAEEIERNRAV